MANKLVKKVDETDSGIELWVNNTRFAVLDCHESEIQTIKDIFFEQGYRAAAVYVSGQPDNGWLVFPERQNENPKQEA